MLRLVFLLIFSATSLYGQVNVEKMRKRNINNGWYNTLNMNISLNRGNEEYFKIQGGFRTDYVVDRFSTFFVGNAEYQEGNESIITNKGFLHLRGVYSLTRLLDGEIFTQAEYNEFINLRERYLGGGGIRLQIFDNLFGADTASRVSLHIGIGAMYEYEELGKNDKYDIYRIIRSTNNVNFYWRINQVFSISEVAYIQPDFANFKDFRMLNDLVLKFNISDNVSFLATLHYRYDSEPVEGIKKFDLDLSNGIQVVF